MKSVGAQRGLLAPAHGARPVARPARARRHARRPRRRGAPDRRLHGRPQVLQRPLPLPGAAPRAVLPVRHLRAEHGLGGGRDGHDRPAAVRRDVRVVPGAAVLRADPHRRRLPRAAGAPDRPPLRVSRWASTARRTTRPRTSRSCARWPGSPSSPRADGPSLAAALRATVDHPGPIYFRIGRGRDPEIYAPGHGVPARAGDRALEGLRPHAAGHGLDGARRRWPRPMRSATRASRSACSTSTRSSRSTARRCSQPPGRPGC